MGPKTEKTQKPSQISKTDKNSEQTTTSTLFSDMQLLAKNVSKDPALQVTVPDNASEPPSSQRYLQVEEPSDQLMPFVGGWIRLNHDHNGAPVIARIVGVTTDLTNIGPQPAGSANLALVRSKLVS